MEEKLKQQWKDVPESDGYFMVSNDGQICSFLKDQAKLRKPYINTSKDGKKEYYQVNILINGIYRSRSLARLVADAFLPKKDHTYKYVSFKDGNSRNVVVTNLMWSKRKSYNPENLENIKKQFLDSL